MHWRTPGNLFGKGVGSTKIQLSTDDRENGDLGAAVFDTRNFISYSKIFLIFGTLYL